MPLRRQPFAPPRDPQGRRWAIPRCAAAAAAASPAVQLRPHRRMAGAPQQCRETCSNSLQPVVTMQWKRQPPLRLPLHPLRQPCGPRPFTAAHCTPAAAPARSAQAAAAVAAAQVAVWSAPAAPAACSAVRKCSAVRGLLPAAVRNTAATRLCRRPLPCLLPRCRPMLGAGHRLESCLPAGMGQRPGPPEAMSAFDGWRVALRVEACWEGRAAAQAQVARYRGEAPAG